MEKYKVELTNNPKWLPFMVKMHDQARTVRYFWTQLEAQQFCDLVNVP